MGGSGSLSVSADYAIPEKVSERSVDFHLNRDQAFLNKICLSAIVSRWARIPLLCPCRKSMKSISPKRGKPSILVAIYG